MPSKNKENVILLPNNDECPVGKTKDETKLLNLVSVEYGIGEDISFFNLQKLKNKYLLKLLFIPAHIGELHSNNAKKFVLYELIKNGIKNVIHIDDDLNKKAAAILDLVNNIDPNAKETISAKLSAILDVNNGLEHILDEFLTDIQYNSFKYTVLNSNKTTCLLCVNASGIYVRSVEAPFEVQDSITWVDIKDITYKQKKLFIHKNYEEITELPFLNKKLASLAHIHLRQYLAFMGSKSVPEPTSWLQRITVRIRKSFSRRSTMRSTAHQVSSPVSEKATFSMTAPYKSAAPSTIPESSFISEDVMENPISVVEPSLKTNSTYDVSLGSDNSYRPTITSLSNEELSNNGDKLSSFQKQMNSSEDHISLKTTSTYEVSLDSRHMVKPMTIDNDSFNATGHLSSFGSNINKVNSPVTPIKKDFTLNEKDNNWHRQFVTKPEETISLKQEEFVKDNAEKSKTYVMEHKSDKVPTDQVDMNTPHFNINKQIPMVAEQPNRALSEVLVNIKTEQSDKNLFDLPIKVATEVPVKVIPEPPIRITSEQSSKVTIVKEESTEKPTKAALIPIVRNIPIQDTNKKLTMTIEPIKEEEILSQCNDIIPEQASVNYNIPVEYSCRVDSIVNDIQNDQSIKTIIIEESKQDIEPNPDLDDSIDSMKQSTEENLERYQEPLENSNTSDNLDKKKNERPEILDLNKPDIENVTVEATKLETKLPVSRQRTIPSPKIQRPSRVPTRGLSSPKEEPNLVIPTKTAQSPSDKENYQNENVDCVAEETAKLSPNFSRFENQEYKVDSKTTFTSVSTVGDSIVKKSTQTEISTVKSTGIPTPVTKQYKSTTTITTTVKKPTDLSKSPSNSGTKIPTGIPRMSSK